MNSQNDKFQIQIDDYVKCYICLGKLTEPTMCPHCSKFSCQKCIQKWLIERKSQCPHCRMPLKISNIINCRFMEEISTYFENIHSLEKKKENCSEHGIELLYYCVTCSETLCSDCYMFGGKHKDHEINRLNNIYTKHVESIEAEARELQNKFDQYSQFLKLIEDKIDLVRLAKQDRSNELEDLFESMKNKLDTMIRSKLLKLLNTKTSISEKIDYLESIKVEVNRQLRESLKSDLIKKSGDLINTLRNLTIDSEINKDNLNISIDVPSEVNPPYEFAIYEILDYKTILAKNKEGIKEKEIIYSDRLWTNGLSWRLKIYPNGNGVAKGEFLSIFLELVEGLLETSKYYYKIELFNFTEKKASYNREFSSDFQNGECWGYNRFYKIEHLEREGYIDPETGKIRLRFYVRPQSYSQLCRDQKNYISLLEKKLAENSQPHAGAVVQKETDINLYTKEKIDIHEEHIVNIQTEEGFSNDKKTLIEPQGQSQIQPKEQTKDMDLGLIFKVKKDEVIKNSDEDPLGDNPNIGNINLLQEPITNKQEEERKSVGENKNDPANFKSTDFDQNIEKINKDLELNFDYINRNIEKMKSTPTNKGVLDIEALDAYEENELKNALRKSATKTPSNQAGKKIMAINSINGLDGVDRNNIECIFTEESLPNSERLDAKESIKQLMTNDGSKGNQLVTTNKGVIGKNSAISNNHEEKKRSNQSNLKKSNNQDDMLQLRSYLRSEGLNEAFFEIDSDGHEGHDDMVNYCNINATKERENGNGNINRNIQPCNSSEGSSFDSIIDSIKLIEDSFNNDKGKKSSKKKAQPQLTDVFSIKKSTNLNPNPSQHGQSQHKQVVKDKFNDMILSLYPNNSQHSFSQNSVPNNFNFYTSGTTDNNKRYQESNYKKSTNSKVNENIFLNSSSNTASLSLNPNLNTNITGNNQGSGLSGETKDELNNLKSHFKKNSK